MTEKRRQARPSGKILVAEDSPTQAEQLRFLLEQHEFIPYIVSNGKEALAFLAEQRVDMVITDIVMPEMDGYELSRCIRADEKLKDIPIIMLTALAEPSAILKGLECGADNFLTKPYAAEYLLSRIRYIFANRELRKTQPLKPGIQVSFGGEQHLITAERQQILDLLLSTFDTAVQKNNELIKAQDVLRELNASLEQKVLERTAELKQSEGSLQRANRALRAISLCNEVLIRATEERGLLRDICNTIVQEAAYEFVWVAYFSPEEAYGGEELATDTQSGVALHVLQTGETAVIQDISAEPPSPWRDEMLQRGYRSAIALPLRFDAAVVSGALVIDSAALSAFTETEVRLLTQMADDLSYGVKSLRTMVERKRLEQQHEEAEQKLKSAMLGTISTMSRTIEQRDPYTAGHQERVARLAEAIAKEMELPDIQAEGVRIGGLIHDIGKIHIPAEILTRPGKLTSMEYEIVKTHAQTGADIVRDVEFPWLIGEMILQHHERLDGSGYPRGLRGGEILLEARILAVADVVEAMSSHRPYRPEIGVQAALAEIELNRGRLYDPGAVDACLRLFKEKGYQLRGTTAAGEGGKS